MTRDKYFSIILQAATEAGRFNVALGPVFKDILSKQKIGQRCDEIIAPLVEAADECLVYGQNEGSEVFRKHADLLIPYRGKFRIEPKGESVTDHTGFWGTGRAERGTVVLVVSLARADLIEKVLARTFNPGFLQNLGTVANRSAISFAHKTVRRHPDKAVFLLEQNRALDALYLFLAEDRLEEYVRKAFELCQWSDRRHPVLSS